MMEETHKRTLVKSISWRIIATATTMVAAYIITGEVAIALGIGAIEATAKLLFYYLHERSWAHVSWGRVERGKSKKIKQLLNLGTSKQQ